MKTFQNCFTLSFLFFLFFSSVSSQTSCSSSLTFSPIFSLNSNSLICVPVWSSQTFFLRYQQAFPNVWSFILSAPSTNAYIAIGFSPSGNMVGSNAVVGWVGSDGMGKVQQYFLGGQTPSSVTVVPANQGLQIGNSSVAVDSNRIGLFIWPFRSPAPASLPHALFTL